MAGFSAGNNISSVIAMAFRMIIAVTVLSNHVRDNTCLSSCSGAFVIMGFYLHKILPKHK